MAILAGILLLAGTTLYLGLRASLPVLKGEVSVAGLQAPVILERDADGVPTLRARSRRDLAFALGFVHAQDRFFQMDLQRRLAGGELAELFGPAALASDREMRRHRFRTVAREVLTQASPIERQLLEAYTAGTNAGLAALGSRPWEYLALTSEPRAWAPEDSLLVAFAMYIDLNDSDGERELANVALRAALPAEILALLQPLGSEWDAPVDGGTWRLPPLPGPDIYDLRAPAARTALASLPSLPLVTRTGDAALGSNSWAVAGSLTANGGALLANDMHLGLQVPNIWYRAFLKVESDDATTKRDLIGVTLPGLPLLITGSNGRVAWGFTNTHGDWTDLVAVTVDPANPDQYLTAAGPQPFVHEEEILRVRGQPDEKLSIESTVWGPITAEANGTPLALAWTAHRPEATNLRMLGLESAATVEEALAIANESGAPVQNFVVADALGHIGWTLFGRVPVREGYDSRFPSGWAAPQTGWTRWREPNEYPHIVDPLQGRLWTANTRTIDATAWLDFVGPGSYVLGARAGQIRDGLLALRAPKPEDMLAIQLDDRALFLSRWRDLVLQLLTPAVLEGHVDRQSAHALTAAWSGRAAVHDAGYRIVRNFRRTVLTRTYEALIAPARTTHPQMDFEPGQQFEGTVWQLVTEQPPHLLDPRHPDWNTALLEWLDESLAALKEECGDLVRCTWGDANVLAMRHPLSRAMPFVSGLLDMPARALPGDANMPRVQSPRQGASERLVVSPGRENEGYFQMPGGQSSHPLSPFHAAGHEAWMSGEPRPLLPGPAEYSLTLSPAR